jgi:hypothetical protein
MATSAVAITNLLQVLLLLLLLQLLLLCVLRLTHSRCTCAETRRA